ncbi:MAG: hypothetical protein O4751_00020, partial [Trichodesmium sp. St2_bin6]|nr:hypothetical protein [Trichodesmium sp. St2_bin6]
KYYDDYLLNGVSPGEQVTVDMTASFDTYLQLVNAATGEVIAYNDDGGSGTNSSLTFTVESSINYLIRSTSYSSGATGVYTVETSRGLMIPSIAPSQSLNGYLGSSTQDNPTRNGKYYNDYLLTGVSPGEQITLNLSADFDTYLQLVNAQTGELITYNDDGGSGRNSRLTFTVESNINYLIRATSYAPAQTGVHTLSVLR